MLFITALVATAGLLLPHGLANPLPRDDKALLAPRQFDNFAGHEFKVTCAPEGKYNLDIEKMKEIKDTFKGFVSLTIWRVHSDYNTPMAEDSGIRVTGRLTNS